MRLTLLTGMGLLLLLAPLASAQQTSELHGGHWVDVVNPTTEQADPYLLSIEQLIQDGKNKEAQKACVEWFKANPGSPVKDRVIFLMAEALYQYGDRIKSFFYLDELLDEYPESTLYYQALEKQYEIADAYLNGYKRRFLRIPMFGAEEEAIEMLFRIRQRSPGSPISEKALLRTADYYYADSEFDLAADAYGKYAEEYPRSPSVPRVRLREAYSNLAQFRGLRFDSTPVLDAQVQLKDIVEKYPDLAAEENIPEVLKRIDSTFARKLAVTADFYRRTHEPRAAAYTDRYLIRAYPNSPEAQQAMSRVSPTTRP